MRQLQVAQAALSELGVPALALEQGEDGLAGVDQELQVRNPLGGFDQHPHRGLEIAAARGHHAAVVEFDDFAPDLREQRLTRVLLAGLGEHPLDVRDHRAIFVVLGGDLAEDGLGLRLVAGGEAGVREVDGSLLRGGIRRVDAVFFLHAGVQGERLVERFARLGRLTLLAAAQTVHDQSGEFALRIAAPVAAKVLGDEAGAGDVAAVEHHPSQVGVVVDDAQTRATLALKHLAVSTLGGVEVFVAGGDFADQALTQGIVGRDVGSLLQEVLRFGEPALLFAHAGDEIVGREVFRKILDQGDAQGFCFGELAEPAQGDGQAHARPGHGGAGQNLLVDDLRFIVPPERVEDLTLEAQGVEVEGRILGKQRFARREGIAVGAFVEVTEDAGEEAFLVQRSGEPRLQLLGGEGLDQVIVGRQLGDGNDVAVGTFGGDQHEHRRQRDEVLFAQLFQQLLAVASVVEVVVGEDEVEIVALDLPHHLGARRRVVNGGETECRQDAAQRVARAAVTVDEKHAHAREVLADLGLQFGAGGFGGGGHVRTLRDGRFSGKRRPRVDRGLEWQ